METCDEILRNKFLTDFVGCLNNINTFLTRISNTNTIYICLGMSHIRMLVINNNT